jgi:hypothetical protein
MVELGLGVSFPFRNGRRPAPGLTPSLPPFAGGRHGHRESLGRPVEDREQRPAWRQPPLGERAGAGGLAVEEPDPDGEDLVEAALAEVGVLERRGEELGLPAST